MLFHIVDPRYFDDCLAQVKRAYWPLDVYLARKNLLRLDAVPGHEDEVIKAVARRLGDIRAEVAEQPLYALFDSSGPTQKSLPMPFLGRFHDLFLKRAWDEPYPGPESHAEHLFRLERVDSGGNYSSQAGNCNHFVNVVAALARLVMFFRNHDNLQRVLEARDAKFTAMRFEDSPDLRTLKLMLAAFYHDIGKSIVDPRHAMEGALILAHHTTSARFQLHRIATAYVPDYEFDRDDLQYVADLVLYHDHFGTLGTGEDSYLPLVSVIDRVKRYSLKHDTNKAYQLDWSRRYLFDLWLLNVGDIMVSLADKYRLQDQWLDADRASDRIERFFKEPKGAALVHDLKIGLALLEQHCQKKHSDDLAPLQEAAHAYSKRHVIERLRRLIVNSLGEPLARHNGPKIPTNLAGMASIIEGLSEESWHARIVRVIQAIGDYGDFCDRLFWIGKMDYALGFFQRIAAAALANIQVERSNGYRTGWIREPENQLPQDLRDRTQAEFFADSYVATVIQILGYLLFRKHAVDRGTNIEFSDAGRRLTDEKVAQLLTLEGPFRARKAIESVLQTVYLY